MIRDLHHTSLFITDITRSIDFYTRCLGFELVNRSDNWGGDFLDLVCGGIENLRINIALIRAGGEIIELIEILGRDDLPSDKNNLPYGIARIGFEVDNIEDTVNQLKTRGLVFMSDIVTVDTKPHEHYSSGKAIKFRDPDGIILELQQPPLPGEIT